MFKTNIYRMPKGLIIDVTDPNDVLVWSDIPRLWNHSNKPVPDLSAAQELTCEDLVRERISKVTKITEGA